MTTIHAQLEQTLKLNHASLTKPRQLVFTALQHQEPLTMQQLTSRCSGVDRASVYRAIELFEKLGIVQRLQVGWKYKLELGEAFQDHHHHATCLACGKVTVLAEDTTIEQYLQTYASKANFQLERHQLELHGYCDNCQTK